MQDRLAVSSHREDRVSHTPCTAECRRAEAPEAPSSLSVSDISSCCQVARPTSALLSSHSCSIVILLIVGNRLHLVPSSLCCVVTSTSDRLMVYIMSGYTIRMKIQERFEETEVTRNPHDMLKFISSRGDWSYCGADPKNNTNA